MSGGAMQYLVCILIGYVIGTINPSYIFSKLHGSDIRKKGSGNAGASNALIVYGKAVGILCAIFDIAKAGIAIWIAQTIYPNFIWAFAITGVSAILGHIFPFYMRFRGGKGLASLGGMIFAYNWIVFLIMLAAEIVIVLVTNYICFVPITAAIAFPVVYGIMRRDLVGALILCIATVVILFKHKENIKRIRKGTEAHFSLLWNRDKEIERVQNNQSKS